MKKNVGTIDAMMRITCGLFGLVWSAVHMSKKPRSAIYCSTAIVSAMKVAEGVLRYCPILDMMRRKTK